MRFRITYQTVQLNTKRALPQVCVEVDAQDQKEAKRKAFEAIHNIFGRNYDTTELVTTCTEESTEW